MREAVITDRQVLDYIRSILENGGTIRATDPKLPVLLTDDNTVVGNLTITYDVVVEEN